MHDDAYYLVTGWHEAADGSMTHTQTWTCDNENSLNEIKNELLATGKAHRSKGERGHRKAFSIRFELVEKVGDGRKYTFLDELWFTYPVPPDWHEL